MLATIPQSTTQSVSETEESSHIKNKYKQSKKENAQLITLLKSSEMIMTQNIEQLRHERTTNERFYAAIMPFIRHSFPKQAESLQKKGDEQSRALELIDFLEDLTKRGQAEDFIKNTFVHDPLQSENKLLNETLKAMQVRMQDSERRVEVMIRLN